MTNERDKGPKTISEIREDAAKAAAEKEAASRAAHANRGNRPMGGGGPRGGDGRSFSQGGYGNYDHPRQQANTSLTADELRRLTQKPRVISSGQQPTFGPPSMFSRNASNPKSMGPSFNRGDASGPASRTGTPPVGQNSSRNSFGYVISLSY